MTISVDQDTIANALLPMKKVTVAMDADQALDAEAIGEAEMARQ
jgi:hypothetical protein